MQVQQLPSLIIFLTKVGHQFTPLCCLWSMGYKNSFLMSHASQQERSSGGPPHSTLMLQDGASTPHLVPLPLELMPSVVVGAHFPLALGTQRMGEVDCWLCHLLTFASSLTAGWVWRFTFPSVPAADSRDVRRTADWLQLNTLFSLDPDRVLVQLLSASC